ncbi:cysteine protease ATG4C-like [Physella acuta]|uniref:cysteine protease ATG4C-like n=1 Tax=Physella acuta TaxID=109671 RepID=UPI0027DE8BF7|nr:cysteine protease ATG4C-like [Physella acuta]
MNPYNSRTRHKSDIKITGENAVGKRLSDDVQSLNSWSEKFSTSSSESGSCHEQGGATSSHEPRPKDFGPKLKSMFHSLITPKTDSSNSSVNKNKKYTHTASAAYECDNVNDDVEWSPSLPITDDLAKDHVNFAYESTLNKQNGFDETDSCIPFRHHNNGKGSAKKQIVTNCAVSNTKKLYPCLESFKHSDTNKEITSNTASTSTKSSHPALAVRSEKKNLSEENNHRSQVLNNTIAQRYESNEPQKNSTPFQKKMFQGGRTESTSLPVSLSHAQNEISPNLLSQYAKSQKVDYSYPQGKATSVDRLHKSQPLLSTSPQLRRQPTSSNDLESYKQSFEHRIEPENVKMKVKSVWNNIKYGWTFKSKPSIKYDSPLFMLGKCYHRRKDDPNTEPEGDFLKDFISRIWLTYRSKFYPIPGTKFNTDCGWGCMLRSGQMLIAQCLVTHYLGRDWRLHDKQTEAESTFYREIIRWFSDPIDTPSDKTPFCLHHLANFGRAYNKDPGEWYGPASVAYIFRDAFTRASECIPILSKVCVYVAQDCTVYIDDVLKLCTARPRSESLNDSAEKHPVAGDTACGPESLDGAWQRSLILLIPMRLGGEAMNEIYIPCVKSLLSHNNCMGIIGGKPKHSLYFLGWQDDKLIYLDPHLCQDAVDTSDKNFRIESFHCMSPRKLTISKMDPSCTVGFYIKNAQDFQKFVYEVKEFIAPPKQKGSYPLFIFSEGSHDEAPGHSHTGEDRGRVKITHYYIDEDGQKKRTFSQESEEFVML